MDAKCAGKLRHGDLLDLDRDPRFPGLHACIADWNCYMFGTVSMVRAQPSGGGGTWEQEPGLIPQGWNKPEPPPPRPYGTIITVSGFSPLRCSGIRIYVGIEQG